jgi:hypothetical protein
MPSVRRAIPPVVGVLLFALTACTVNPSGPATSGPSSLSATRLPTTAPPTSEDSAQPTAGLVSSTEEPTDGLTSIPAFAANTDNDTGEASGRRVGTLVDIRVGAHGGFDRVVFEFEGPDQPGWKVGYVAKAIGDPSGTVVDVNGSAVLQVLIQPVAYPEDGDTPYEGPHHVSVTGTEAVTETVLSSIFEGEFQAFIGTHGTRPFRVYALSEPARVVVEVQTT